MALRWLADCADDRSEEGIHVSVYHAPHVVVKPFRVANGWWTEPTRIADSQLRSRNGLTVSTDHPDEIRKGGRVNGVLTYTYNRHGDVISVRDDDGVEVESTYGPRRELEEMRWFGREIDEVRVRFTYDRALQPANIERYKGASANPPLVGITEVIRDASSRPSAMIHADAGGGPLVDYLYDYDPADRLTLEDSHGEVVSYSYDRTGQLTDANRSVFPDEFYRYDANGNRVDSYLHGPDYLTGTDNRLLSDGVSGGQVILAGSARDGDAVRDHQHPGLVPDPGEGEV